MGMGTKDYEIPFEYNNLRIENNSSNNIYVEDNKVRRENLAETRNGRFIHNRKENNHDIYIIAHELLHTLGVGHGKDLMTETPYDPDATIDLNEDMIYQLLSPLINEHEAHNKKANGLGIPITNIKKLYNSLSIERNE